MIHTGLMDGALEDVFCFQKQMEGWMGLERHNVQAHCTAKDLFVCQKVL